MTAREVADMFHLSIRTANNRLATFRKDNPTAYKEITTNTKHKKYLYKASAITKENVGTRHYIRKEKHIQNTELPPIYIVDVESGTKYNYFALKALLRVLESTTMFERFVALDSFIFILIIIYLCL
jgi:transposase